MNPEYFKSHDQINRKVRVIDINVDLSEDDQNKNTTFTTKNHQEYENLGT